MFNEHPGSLFIHGRIRILIFTPTGSRGQKKAPDSGSRSLTLFSVNNVGKEVKSKTSHSNFDQYRSVESGWGKSNKENLKQFYFLRYIIGYVLKIVKKCVVSS
jgi:hypothetical protein